MRKLIFFLAVFCFFSLVSAYAADPTEIDPAVIDSILAGGLLGFGVIAVTQILKMALKVNGAVVYGISLVVAAAATVVFLFTGGGGFTILKFVGYSVAVWAVANGWYKFKTA